MGDVSERIDNDFRYHPATEETAPKHEFVRAVCRRAANELLEVVPAGRKQSLALTKLEEAMFWANAGIARPS